MTRSSHRLKKGRKEKENMGTKWLVLHGDQVKRRKDKRGMIGREQKRLNRPANDNCHVDIQIELLE